MIRILFVCQGNSCRSVMAEAIAKDKLRGIAEVSSAGISPQKAGDSGMAIETLQIYFGLDASGHVPRSIRSVDLQSFNYVVAMSPGVAKQLPNLSCALLAWDIKDPWLSDSEAYLKCAKAINNEVSKLAMILKHVKA